MYIGGIILEVASTFGPYVKYAISCTRPGTCVHNENVSAITLNSPGQMPFQSFSLPRLVVERNKKDRGPSLQ